MRLIALLPWFDEAPSWLAGAVSSLAKVGVEHIVAADGCYQLFPGALERPRSFVDQAATIMEAAEGLGIGCTIVRPAEAWQGNEVEKRNALFDCGRLIAGEDKAAWFYCFDADERVLTCHSPVADVLANTDANVAEISVVTPVDPQATEARAAAAAAMGFPHERMGGYRCFFRNLPGLSVELAHYIVGYDHEDGDRAYLRGRTDLYELEEAVEIPFMVVEHRTNFRERSRSEAAQSYYRVRDACGAERLREMVMESVDGGLARVA